MKRSGAWGDGGLGEENPEFDIDAGRAEEWPCEIDGRACA